MKNKWAAFSLLATTQFVLILDSTIVGIAMPHMGRELGMNAQDLSWTTTAYSLVFGGLLLLGGRLSDYVGRRRIFIAGMLLFGAVSLIGGVAASGGPLIAVRAVQGLASALVAPAGMSLVMTIFKGDPALNKAMGLWGAVGGMGASAGLVLGGLLTDWFGWRSVFLVNAPIGLGVAALALVLLPAARSAERARGFDVTGAVTSTAGLGLLIYALVDAAEAGWTSARTLGVGALAIALIVAFLAVEHRSANPLVPLNVFRRRTLRAGNVIMFLVAMAMQPVAFLLSLYTQLVLGYSATLSGLATLAIPATIALTASFLGGRVLTRYGLRTTAAAGMAFILVGAALYLRVGVQGDYLLVLLPSELLTGFGFGLLIGAVTVAATSDASPEESGMVSGLFNVTTQVGISVGIAVLVAIAAGVAGGSPAPEALVSGYRMAFLGSTVLSAIGLVAALTMLPRPARDREPVAVSA
ncbi:MFS transporter [Nonomuraea angiospora]|uniref:EmrB/QacA subfamily drug resistance transporter n=1 Tax=Nonomuraea angiospora TaxID=46172 RepID=A0ABR9MAW0_9ACTN|nr:MFS transporter [Nonomuraea angiospora]MBE1590044.1 EmrB/QacA subfamily drug resistance transporter [Nonomuraea angiospora]